MALSHGSPVGRPGAAKTAQLKTFVHDTGRILRAQSLDMIEQEL
jgi:hypothetical protein